MSESAASRLRAVFSAIPEKRKSGLVRRHSDGSGVSPTGDGWGGGDAGFRPPLQVTAN